MITTTALLRLAARGDADAQFRLGYRFAFCKDKRRRTVKRAFSMWKAAAEQGHVRARFYLVRVMTSEAAFAETQVERCSGITKRPWPTMMSRSTTLLWGIETASEFHSRSASR